MFELLVHAYVVCILLMSFIALAYAIVYLVQGIAYIINLWD